MNTNKSKIQNLKSKIAIGCQGWNYADWTTRIGSESVFYPHGTRSSEMLEIYARAFDTVEVDSTFYAIPSTATLENWLNKTPPDFTFSLKMPQEITHEHALQRGSFQVLDDFCERITILQDKLAVVLIQLPPQFEATQENTQVLQSFLRQLPREMRFAVEFRNRGWLDAHTFDALAKHNVALCLTEGSWLPRASVFQAAGEKIANFAYVRFMGERDLTSFDRVQRPQDANLQIWREVLQEVVENTPQTAVYFSNFYEGFAPAGANKLKEMFGQEVIKPESLENQPSLF